LDKDGGVVLDDTSVFLYNNATIFLHVSE